MNRDKLIKIFLEKNSQINLSAIRDADGVLVKHIQDSLELDKVLQIPPKSSLSQGRTFTVCDVGTGGGFPLLPLAMTHSDVSFIGIDSV
ncbi:class I SAM-dependent methyltransferase [Patescibacteria group bacterium]|nr:class I SAM-dependent methyltransferase [Patescibacteria group bacterium]MBU1758316.1 class I SAM-dependent methyltransferase [Patescibacteria group bacterium]